MDKYILVGLLKINFDIILEFRYDLISPIEEFE